MYTLWQCNRFIVIFWSYGNITMLVKKNFQTNSLLRNFPKHIHSRICNAALTPDANSKLVGNIVREGQCFLMHHLQYCWCIFFHSFILELQIILCNLILDIQARSHTLNYTAMTFFFFLFVFIFLSFLINKLFRELLNLFKTQIYFKYYETFLLNLSYQAYLI